MGSGARAAGCHRARRDTVAVLVHVVLPGRRVGRDDVEAEAVPLCRRFNAQVQVLTGDGGHPARHHHRRPLHDKRLRVAVAQNRRRRRRCRRRRCTGIEHRLGLLPQQRHDDGERQPVGQQQRRRHDDHLRAVSDDGLAHGMADAVNHRGRVARGSPMHRVQQVAQRVHQRLSDVDVQHVAGVHPQLQGGRVAVVAPVSCTTPTRVCVATTAATACERFVVPWYTGWWRRPRGWCLWRQPLFEHRHDEGPLLHQRLPLAEPGVVVVGGDAGRDGHLDLGDGREDTGVHRRQPQFQQAVVALAGETAGFVTASAAYTARAAERQRVQLLCRGPGRLADGMPYAAGRAAPHTTAHI